VLWRDLGAVPLTLPRFLSPIGSDPNGWTMNELRFRW
jgi:hypothetical protein